MERKKLIGLRKGKGWKVREAAERLEVDDNTLYKWESGKATPHGYNIGKLCEVYGVTEEELGLEGCEEVVAPPEQLSPYQSAFVATDLTMRLLGLAFAPYKDFQSVQIRLAQIIEEADAMFNDPITRRDALRRLATLPAIFSIPLSASESLTQYAASIAACWQLSKSKDDADIDLAFQGVSIYASQLKALIPGTSHEKLRKAAASLVGQCSILRATLGWHRGEGLKAAGYAQEALNYSVKAADLPLQISAHIKLAWIYYYTQQYKRSLEECNHAAQLLKDSTTPLPSGTIALVHSNHALRQAIHGQEAEAARSLSLAHTYIARKSTDESSSIYLDSSFFLEEGMTYARLGMHDTALQSFEHIIDSDNLTPKIPMGERVRIEVLNNKTLSLLKSSKKRDMEQVLHYWKAAIAGATTLKSEQRFNEALKSYDLMEAAWPGESRVKELRELTGHW